MYSIFERGQKTLRKRLRDQRIKILNLQNWHNSLQLAKVITLALVL